MTEQSIDPNTTKMPTGDQPPGTPLWVKIFGIIVIVVVLLVVVVLVTGLGGEHGPSRHMPAGETPSNTPSASITEDHTPPVEHDIQQP